jgi:hypothetical protein
MSVYWYKECFLQLLWFNTHSKNIHLRKVAIFSEQFIIFYLQNLLEKVQKRSNFGEECRVAANKSSFDNCALYSGSLENFLKGISLLSFLLFFSVARIMEMATNNL